MLDFAAIMGWTGYCTRFEDHTDPVCGEQAHCESRDVDIPCLCRECSHFVPGEEEQVEDSDD